MMLPEDSKSRAILRVLKENVGSEKRVYAIAILAMVVVAAMTSATAWIMKAIFDVLSDAPGAFSAPVVASTVMAIFLTKGLAGFVQQVALSKAGNRIVSNIQMRLYRKLLQQKAAWFDATPSSNIVVSVTQSAMAARSLIDIVVTSFVRDLLTLVGLVLVMIYQQAVLSMIFLVIGPIALIGVRAVLGRVRKIMAAELASLTEIIEVIQETATGLRVVRAFGLEPLLERRMAKAVRDVEKRSNAMVRLESATAPMMDSLAGAAIATIILVSGLSVGLGADATPGALMAFVTALLMAYEPAKRLSRMRVSIEASLVGVNMMFTILDSTETMSDADDAISLPAGRGDVALRDVSFSYDGTRDVISNMSLAFAAGKTTALVGPSGGGKSTIMGLLLRLYDPVEGAVLVDGADIRKVTRQSLQQRLAYVGQHTFLFSDTVLNNIRMGRNGATDAEIESAAIAAQAHDFIRALPQGYDTEIGENGFSLSGGQRQRLSIARAILKDAPILLLDEATSALDNESERRIRDAILAATKGRTTILIAHRLSTIMAADEIVFVENGRIVEQGTIENLLSKNSRFKALFGEEIADEAAGF